ncbi:MAG: hypothetical protein QOF60_3338, partial [Actinomycetota bacterium]|nr:hypothetical protein [Actinomycetota bacterium]
MTSSFTAEPSPRRRRLVWLMASLSALALLTSAVLAFYVLPREHRVSSAAIDRMELAIHTEELFVKQAAVQREFLLTGDVASLDEFDGLEREFVTAVDGLRRSLPPDEGSKYDTAIAAYEAFLSDHSKVVAAARAGNHEEAVALGLGQAKRSWVAAETRFHGLHEDVAADARRELDTNATRST